MNDGFQQIGAVDLSTVANIATALTVLTAVIFGVIEMRHARKEREERAAFVAVQAILTPAWMDSMTLVQAIAEGTTPSQIETDPRLFQAAQVHSLHSRISRLCGVCAHGSVKRSRRTAGRHSARRLAQVAWLRRIRT
jgi:hypothetical protein